jgi:antitoxin component YwqK of YwqJK toxin-antitoxin module
LNRIQKLTLLIPLFLAIVGCTKEVKEVPAYQIVERGGVKYEVNSTTPFTGTSVLYYNNGQVREKANFKDGKLNGLYESFFMNGQLNFMIIHKDGNEELREEYNENGQLVYKQTPQTTYRPRK